MPTFGTPRGNTGMRPYCTPFDCRGRGVRYVYECCEGGLYPEWFIEEKDRKTFQEFRLKLSGQMLTYDPKDQNTTKADYPKKSTFCYPPSTIDDFF